MTRRPSHSLVHHTPGCKNAGIDYYAGTSRLCPFCGADMTTYTVRYAAHLEAMRRDSAEYEGDGGDDDCAITVIS